MTRRARLDRAEYAKLDDAEDRMWWFAALHRNLLALYRAMIGAAERGGPLLDAGCGTGGLLARIAAEDPARTVVGLDLDRVACLRAAAKSGRPVCAGSIDALPFGDAAFNAIFSADVLCHRGVDEGAALREFSRCLGPDGLLVLNLPAYRWMMSRHDRAVANVRRYTSLGIGRLLRAAGFRVLFTSYWNAVLFPVMVAARKLLPSANAISDVRIYPPAIEALCRAATGLETTFLGRGWRLGFGGSLIAVAIKEAPHA